jgi:tetratricopeptide (TPR) repeat protein
MNLGQDEAAEASLRESVEFRERALKAGATDMRTRNVLAHTLGTWSTLSIKSKRHDEATVLARRGVELMQELAAANPSDVRFADDRAFLRSKLADALLAAAKFSEAAAEYRLAIQESDAVLGRDAKSPQLPRWRDRASWHVGLGSALVELGKTDEARAYLTEAIATFDRVGREGLPVAAYEADRRQAADLLAGLASTR